MGARSKTLVPYYKLILECKHKAGFLHQGYIHLRPSESEFPHVLESLGDSDTHFGFKVTDTKKWLRKPATIKDLHTTMS